MRPNRTNQSPVAVVLIAGLLFATIGLITSYFVRRDRANDRFTQINTEYSIAWKDRIASIVSALKRYQLVNGRSPNNKAEFVEFDPVFGALYTKLPNQRGDIEIWFELLGRSRGLVVVPEPGYYAPGSVGLLSAEPSYARYANDGRPIGIFDDLSYGVYDRTIYEISHEARSLYIGQ